MGLVEAGGAVRLHDLSLAAPSLGSVSKVKGWGGGRA